MKGPALGTQSFDEQVRSIHTRVVEDLEFLSTLSEGGPGVTRLAYSSPDVSAREWFREECQKIGLTYEIDQAGNAFAWSLGAASAPPLLLASHLDTVIEAGKYDGIVGVVVGLEIARELSRDSSDLPFGVGVFAAEESTRFGIGTIGSRLLTGELDYADAELLRDRFGNAFADVIREAGLDGYPRRIVGDDFIGGLIEVHIDQGTLLANSEARIGIVETIAGVNRSSLTWHGQASHSGGRRRSERKDALLAAAEFLTELDRLWAALDEQAFIQMTVGQLDVTPNSPNTVPGKVAAIIDVRALDNDLLNKAVEQAHGLAAQLGARRDVPVETHQLGRLLPVDMHEALTASLQDSARDLGINAPLIPSFAGHDAMILAKRFSTAMVLVANPTGMSHTPEESFDPEGLSEAIATVLRTVTMAGEASSDTIGVAIEHSGGLSDKERG